MFWDYILFFSAGLFQDLLITYYYQVVAKERAVSAALSSVVVTLVNLFVLYNILSNLTDQTYSIILVYALGNGVGTFIVIKRHELKRVFPFRRKK
jgi:uncharacterized protein YebE (UPF0316 family)